MFPDCCWMTGNTEVVVVSGLPTMVEVIRKASIGTFNVHLRNRIHLAKAQHQGRAAITDRQPPTSFG